MTYYSLLGAFRPKSIAFGGERIAESGKRKKCLKNYVSSLNSGTAMADEMSNFPTTMVFSRKSPWLNARLNLNLLRLASARMQLKPAYSASESSPYGNCGQGWKPEAACREGKLWELWQQCQEKIDGRDFFVPVGLAFCALRVSIRVDVKCGGQLTT